MGAMASRIANITIVYLTVYTCVVERNHQSSASLAFVRGIHRWPVNSPHQGPVTRKMFSIDDVIMTTHDTVCEFYEGNCTSYSQPRYLLLRNVDRSNPPGNIHQCQIRPSSDGCYFRCNIYFQQGIFKKINHCETKLVQDRYTTRFALEIWLNIIFGSNIYLLCFINFIYFDVACGDIIAVYVYLCFHWRHVEMKMQLIRLFDCPSPCLSVCLSVRLSVCLSVCLSASPFHRCPICMSLM